MLYLNEIQSLNFVIFQAHGYLFCIVYVLSDSFFAILVSNYMYLNNELKNDLLEYIKKKIK